ncbi:MAG: electron transfer flavoprotein subunit beta/FixA family protein [Candidatus Kapabacteria bacterium]|nr:electron transfer flavoprotein subunit beta/FixA family protein [Ignavibacteriota bacterium]MCW5883685.1 electron transfer flavoprotein subunit beta/FixA family protein [Candidatus Kapabacteria bacterium]
MNILVFVSRVPDTATKIFVGVDGKNIDSKGVKYILNPYDEFALEEGLRLREKNGGTVTAVTVGSAESSEILRTALAMGADNAVFIKGENLDSYQTAFNLAEYAKTVSYDIIFAGRQSVDFDSFQVPSMVAGLLDIPSISVVSKLEVIGNEVKAERDIEGGKEAVEATLPCLISCQKGLNEPRYPKLPDIMKAKKKPIDEIDAKSVESTVSVIGMELPSKQRVGKILGDSDADIAEIIRSLQEDAKVI